jgi:chromatin remodeling complex protein RSC6
VIVFEEIGSLLEEATTTDLSRFGRAVKCKALCCFESAAETKSSANQSVVTTEADDDEKEEKKKKKRKSKGREEEDESPTKGKKKRKSKGVGWGESVKKKKKGENNRLGIISRRVLPTGYILNCL